MEIYKLIIKNIIKTDENIFSQNYKHDNIKWYIKLAFSVFSRDLSIENKYKKMSEMLNGFLIKEKQKQDDFIDYYYKIQKTYNTLTRFVYNYKFKKTKIVVNTDMCLNELKVTDKNVMCIIDNNSKYLFHVNDLINIINASLTNSYLFFSEPKSVKNPYNNLPFNKSTLYNIYFYIRYKTDYYPELLFKFFECNFNLTKFKFSNENLLREYSIENYVYNSPANVIEKEIRLMILSFNLQCKRMCLKNRILINEDFPSNKLVTIMKPYLFLYCKALYSFHPQVKKQYSDIFKLSMLRFNKFNPQFGRKKTKLLYKTTKYFQKKMCGKEIIFDDKCINFYDIEKQNENFLSDHLKYHEVESNFILNNSFIFNHYEEEDPEEEEEDTVINNTVINNTVINNTVIDNTINDDEQEEEEEDDNNSVS